MFREKRTYKVGQSIKLIKHKDNDEIIWPESNFVWLPFIFLALVGLMWYTNKDKFTKQSKPE